MPLSISPELGFEVSLQNSKDLLPSPPVTNLSPQEIVDILKGKSDSEIVIDPKWFVERAIKVAENPAHFLARKARRVIVFSATLFSTS